MAMNHIRYLNDKVALCDQPARLDHTEFVFTDYHHEESCGDCSTLLMVANKKAYDDELAGVWNNRLEKHEVHKHFKDERAAMWAGVLLGVFIMSFVFALLWLLGAF
jgi:hypothetical protein